MGSSLHENLSVALLFGPAPLHRNISNNENPAKVDDFTSAAVSLDEIRSVVQLCDLDCAFNFVDLHNVTQK